MGGGKETDETCSDVRGFDSYEVSLGDLMRGERATMGKSLLDVQRELRIKAAYIAAIENCEPGVFQTPGFIAGYVRSYARYLSLDPDAAFKRFQAESAFVSINPAAKTSSPVADILRRTPAKPRTLPEAMANPTTPFVPPQTGILGQVSLSGLGSSLVLAALIGGLSYGGWSVLQDFQRVQFAPVNETPGVGLDMTSLESPEFVVASEETPARISASDPVALERLYSPQELEMPFIVARDGPIGTLDPDKIGALAPEQDSVDVATTSAVAEDVVVASADAVSVFASRPAWIRITQRDGTVLFEKILDAGESYVLPDNTKGAILRAGNSGAVFVAVGDRSFGPVGAGTSVVKSIALDPNKIFAAYNTATEIATIRPQVRPKVVSEIAPETLGE